jgi:ribonuclease VapC
MVVDSSAVVAIALREPDSHLFARSIDLADDPLLSTVSFVASATVLFGRIGEEGLERLDRLIVEFDLRRVAVDLRQAQAAREAWMRFGKGNSPARLNLGDCFSYALARTLNRPLLFKGGDFLRTDVAVA